MNLELYNNYEITHNQFIIKRWVLYGMSASRICRLLLIASIVLTLCGCSQGSDGSEDSESSQDSGETSGISKNIRSLGYVQGTVDSEINREGVILHEAEDAFQGYNFYTSRREDYARLINMEGEVVHQWHKKETGEWLHATLLENGDILVLVKDKHVFKLDRDSRELWRYEARVHHDLWVTTDGKIYVLARGQEEDSSFHPKNKIVKDRIDVLSPEGRLERQIPLLDIIERSPFAYLIERWNGLVAMKVPRANEHKEEFDLLHPNHVEVFDGSLSDKNRLYERGNILTVARNMNAVMIIDGRTEEIVWLWGPNNLIFPHHPVLLPSGNILIFNNGTSKTRSQVLEVNPLTNRIEWSYGPVKEFFSRRRGSVQRLPNGNTLITESDTGYVFEVTQDGRKVWEFANPDREEDTRMAIWRMVRFAPNELDFLDKEEM